jgi:hypothetical protein
MVAEQRAQEQAAPSPEKRETATVSGKPGCFSLGCGILTLLVGVAFLGMYIFFRNYAVTAEGELTLAEGVPDDVEFSTVRHRRGGGETHHVKFTVGGKRTQYASDRPHYEDLVRTLESQEPVRAWVSTKQLTLFEKPSPLLHLYKLEQRGRMIISYEDVISADEQESMAVLIVGIAVSSLGVMGLFLYYRARKKYHAHHASSLKRLG